MVGLHLAQLPLEYPSRPQSKPCCGEGGGNAGYLKKGTFAVVVALLYTIGIKLIADAFEASADGLGEGLVRIALAAAIFLIATPILFFLVLGFAAPYPY